MPDLRLLVDRLMAPLLRHLDSGKMRPLGIRTTMRLAKLYNYLLRGERQRARTRAYRTDWQRLQAENGKPCSPPRRLSDGWVLDTSMSLPHLEPLLEQADAIIAERAGKHVVDDRYRAYFRNLIQPDDLADYPALLDFVTSNEVLATVCDYLGFVPALSKTLPTGVRFVESGEHVDGLAHLPPRDSQLYHIDIYDHPMVYILVLLHEHRPEHGPFTFLPASLSRRVSQVNGYWSKGKDYRLSDEEVYSVVSPEQALTLTFPRGSVLFIDTSRCLHYGARHGKTPRFQMMYALTHVCRSDFSESYMEDFEYPRAQPESQLRRMVVDRRW